MSVPTVLIVERMAVVQMVLRAAEPWQRLAVAVRRRLDIVARHKTVMHKVERTDREGDRDMDNTMGEVRGYDPRDGWLTVGPATPSV